MTDAAERPGGDAALALRLSITAHALATAGTLDALTTGFTLIAAAALVFAAVLGIAPPVAVAAIERLRRHGPVLVCCALGYSRSACAVAAWLLATHRVPSVEAALLRVREARAEVVLGPRHAAALRTLPACVTA